MQHLINAFTTFAAELFVALGGFEFKTFHFDIQTAKIALLSFITHRQLKTKLIEKTRLIRETL